MKGISWLARSRAIQPPPSATTPLAAASEAHCGTSCDLATSPRRRASSSLRGVASSVLEPESAVSDTAASDEIL